MALHNFSPEPVSVRLPAPPEGSVDTVLLESRGSAPQTEYRQQLLDGYGFRWLRLSSDGLGGSTGGIGRDVSRD